MADTTLQLENFTFSGLGVPDRISVGGSQQTATHRLIGGTKIIDAMGRDDLPLEWNAIFLGPDAVQNARYLDGLRIAGKQVPVTWGEFNYTVIVKDFKADYLSFHEIPFSITLEVVSDNTSQLAPITGTTPDDAIAADLDTANTLAPQIGDAPLSGLVLNLNDAIAAVATFAHAPKSLVNSILQPLNAVQLRVGVLITANDATIGAAVGFGGIVAGAPFMDSAAALAEQQQATLTLSACLNLRGVCGRMGNNLLAINASDNTITVAGGNLFQIASDQYGDPTAWTGIAKANGLTDPFITGLATLAIPPSPDTTDGVLTG